MEEEGIAGLHLDVDQGQPLEDLLDAVHVGAGLLAGQDVIDPAQAVRALDHLQAAVLPGARIDRDEDAHEVGEEDAVLVPVAVILVPGPGPADLGVLHDHLGVVVIDLVVEDLLAGIDHPPAAGEHAVDAVARVVPEREPDPSPFAVVLAEGVLVEGPVLLGRAEQEADLVGVEQRTHQQVAVCARTGRAARRRVVRDAWAISSSVLSVARRPRSYGRGPAAWQPEEDLAGIPVVQLGQNVVGQEDAVDLPEALDVMAAGRDRSTRRRSRGSGNTCDRRCGWAGCRCRT